jgi:EpsI family protein
MISNARFAAAAVLLAAVAVFLHARGRSEILAARQPLASFPYQMGSWSGTDISIPADMLEILGPGDFLFRSYQNSEAGIPDVEIFLAYFPSQRAGDTVHSPRNCLPGAGWSPVNFDRVSLSFAGHSPFPANRYVIAKGDDRALVLYWYWAHDRGVASEYWAKFYLVADSIRLHRSDGSLIRLTTPLAAGESVDGAQQRLIALAGKVVPILGEYVPR